MIRLFRSVPVRTFVNTHRLPLASDNQLVRGCVGAWSLHREKSTVATEKDIEWISPSESASASLPSPSVSAEIQRLKRIRNVGILAHVDAGKTTVTERMLALAGVVHRAGSVDDGDTVTDYLPAERERGITIQSAAISFEWGWHNNRAGDDYDVNDSVQVQLIDTPGHVDFSVEVNRSVAVLDGAILVVDAVAGVQAQTETVWRAITRPTLNNHDHDMQSQAPQVSRRDHGHEPLPCIALINKMDKDGCHFGNAVNSLRYKLPGANPIPTQMPIFLTSNKSQRNSSTLNLHTKGDKRRFMVVPLDRSDADVVNKGNKKPQTDGTEAVAGDFVGVVDLVHMRAVVWPHSMNVDNIDDCAPEVVPLLRPSNEPFDAECIITKQAAEARQHLFESLAEVDEKIEEYYLVEDQPSNSELRAALRRATLAHKAVPVMAAAAIRGKGVEPILDAIADLLPSPLDRLPPALTRLDAKEPNTTESAYGNNQAKINLGHALHPSLLALAFKVLHMKGRGGSGDGRVVFARIYSGKIQDGDTVLAISPPSPGEPPEKPRSQRVGGMLTLAGGQFKNLSGGECRSGDVCALVGLKNVVTGDTIVLPPAKASSKKSKKGKKTNVERVCLAGVASPKPVLTVRLEPETADQQTLLSEALNLLAIEDPSLYIEETGNATLLSGLGELHIEVTLDRLYREFGLRVMRGPPSVTYRETITHAVETPDCTLLNYDRTVGGTRLQASVHLLLEPNSFAQTFDSGATLLSEPLVTVAPAVKEFLGLEDFCSKKGAISDEELIRKCSAFKALVQGCHGALRRGPLGSYAMANVKCHVLGVGCEEGLPYLQALPGALRAAAANAVATALLENDSACRVLEPSMSIEVTLPSEMVGPVLSDLTTRRGVISNVILDKVDYAVGAGGGSASNQHSKALIRGEVPLIEVIGYANNLRSLTGGEGSFTAEYKGHTPCTNNDPPRTN